MITEFDTERNAGAGPGSPLDLTTLVTVLTDTPDASNATICQGYIKLGDGSYNLDGSGGDFQLVITVGGQTIQPSPQVVTFGTEVRSAIWTSQFPVPANEEVILRVLSPNADDTDVDVTAYLYDATSGDTLAISTDATAADNFETMLNGTGGNTLSLGQLVINANAAGGAIDIDNIGGPGIDIDGELVITANAPGGAIDIYNSGGPGIDIDGSTHGVLINGAGGVGLRVEGSTQGIYAIGVTGFYVYGSTDGLYIDGSSNIGLYATGGTYDINADIQGSLSGSVGSVTAGVSLADDAITSAKFDESTAYPLKSDDSGATQVARTGADSDTLETISDQIDDIDEEDIQATVADIQSSVDVMQDDIDTLKTQSDAHS